MILSIYVTGYSHGEIGEKAYRKQQEMVEKWNEEIEDILVMYM